MNYLDRMGDMPTTSLKPHVCIINNWEKHPPRFCFIIPTYKRADLLRYAISSCMNQEGFKNDCEILVVDDNPTRDDETERLMLSDYNLPKVAYYKNDVNLRQEGNWNKLFQLSRAEWLIMLHDDDMLYPDYLHYTRLTMERYGHEVKAFFPPYLGSEYISDHLPVRNFQPLVSRVIKKADFLQGYVVAAPVGMCANREAALSIGGVIEASSVAVDYDFCLRLSKIGNIVKQYGYPLGAWRIMENVSQHKKTVLSCMEFGDMVMKETLKDVGLTWLMPLYERYLKEFDNRHLTAWYVAMKKGVPEQEDLNKTGIVDKIVYWLFRSWFTLRRRMRRGKVIMGIS